MTNAEDAHVFMFDANTLFSYRATATNGGRCQMKWNEFLPNGRYQWKFVGMKMIQVPNKCFRSIADIWLIIIELMQSMKPPNKPPSFSCSCAHDAFPTIAHEWNSKWKLIKLNWIWVKAAIAGHTNCEREFLHFFFWFWFCWFGAFMSLDIRTRKIVKFYFLLLKWKTMRYLIFLLRVPVKLSQSLRFVFVFCLTLLVTFFFRCLLKTCSISRYHNLMFPRNEAGWKRKIFHFHAPCLFPFHFWLDNGWVNCLRKRNAVKKQYWHAAECVSCHDSMWKRKIQRKWRRRWQRKKWRQK